MTGRSLTTVSNWKSRHRHKPYKAHRVLQLTEISSTTDKILDGSSLCLVLNQEYDIYPLYFGLRFKKQPWLS